MGVIALLLRHSQKIRNAWFGLFLIAFAAGLYFVYRNLMFWSIDNGVSAYKDAKGATAIYYLQIPAWLGDKPSQTSIACIYFRGMGEVRADFEMSKYWFTRVGAVSSMNLSFEQFKPIAQQYCSG
jgi:TPR repeat protein